MSKKAKTSTIADGSPGLNNKSKKISKPTEGRVAAKTKGIKANKANLSKTAPSSTQNQTKKHNVPVSKGKAPIGVRPTSYSKTHQKTQVLDDLFEKARDVYEHRIKNLRQGAAKSQDYNMMKKILKSGTFTDKVSALAIEVRDRPKLALDQIQSLIAMTETKNRKQAILALNSLYEIFTDILLPKGKVLNNFKTALANRKNRGDNDLFEAYYEHLLREYFLRFLGCIQRNLNDDLSFFRQRNIELLGQLLEHIPPIYQNIFPILVNKFGDKDKKLITVINNMLGKLIFKQKTLTLPLIKEIEQFAMRPNNPEDAQFYSVNFLFAMNYKEMDSSTLIYLTNLLFRLFFYYMKSKTDLDKSSKILRTLLNSLNKAYVFCKNLGEDFRSTLDENLNQLFKLSHESGLKIRIQSLVLIFQFLKASDSLNDRFYRVLYELLFDPNVKTSTDLQLVFDLTLNALKQDFSIVRIEAFIKRLLQVAVSAEPPFIITSLLFISKMIQFHPGTLALFQFKEKTASVEKEDEEEFKDVPESDAETEDKKEKKKKSTKETQNTSEKPKSKKKNEESQMDIENEKNKKEPADGKTEDDGKKKSFSTEYDPLKREPLFANADRTLVYEILPLANHFHPTVKKYATTLLNNIKEQGSTLDYQGNPLLDFSLANMLDRLEFKKPKLKGRVKSDKQQIIRKTRMSKFIDPVSLETLQGENPRDDEEFFVKFFEQRAKTKKPKKKKANLEDGDEDEDDVDAYADELFEKELAKDVDEDDDLDMDEEEIGDEMSEEEDFGDILENATDEENDYYNHQDDDDEDDGIDEEYDE